MAKTKKQGENSACSALFERAYYSSGYGILNDYVIVTPVGHLITDLKKGDILNVLLYTGTNFEDLSQKHMQF